MKPNHLILLIFRASSPIPARRERLVHVGRRSIEGPCVYKASAGLARLDECGPVVRAPESLGVAYEDQPTPRARDRDAESARVAEEAHVANVVGAGGGEDHEVRLLALKGVNGTDAAHARELCSDLILRSHGPSGGGTWSDNGLEARVGLQPWREARVGWAAMA